MALVEKISSLVYLGISGVVGLLPDNLDERSSPNNICVQLVRVHPVYNHLPSQNIKVEVAMTPNAKDEDQANNEEFCDRMMTGV